MLSGLDGSRRAALLEAMSVIRGAFSAPAGQAQVSLRTHRPGDMGWVVERHGALYFREYGWNEEFEALVAGITADFIRTLDPARERCWIAESTAGRRLGCIFLVAGESGTAKLRLLLVEPEARGLGLGRMLVSECVRFARAAGYERIVLWTQENLAAARHLYEQAGFPRTASGPHRSLGQALVGESLQDQLAGRRAAARHSARGPCHPTASRVRGRPRAQRQRVAAPAPPRCAGPSSRSGGSRAAYCFRQPLRQRDGERAEGRAARAVTRILPLVDIIKLSLLSECARHPRSRHRQ